jgi:hypothetical protein
MTTNYDAAVTALSSNEELRKKVMSATSAEERAGHLRDHGLEIPTHEEINSRHSDLADVTGAGGNTTGAFVSGLAIGAASAC